MKRIWGVLVALALVASTVLAGEVGDNQPRRNPTSTAFGAKKPDGTQDVAVFDTTGGARNLQVSEGNKDRDLWLNTVAINDSVSLASVCDSTASAIYTAPYGRLFLHIKPTAFAGVTWMRFAVQVEGGFGSTVDSVTFLPWMHPLASASSDSLSYGNTTVGSRIAVNNAEIQVTVPFTQNGAVVIGGVTPGAYVEIVDSRGLPYWAPYTKLRVRLIASNLSAVWTNLTVRLLGRPF